MIFSNIAVRCRSSPGDGVCASAIVLVAAHKHAAMEPTAKRYLNICFSTLGELQQRKAVSYSLNNDLDQKAQRLFLAPLTNSIGKEFMRIWPRQISHKLKPSQSTGNCRYRHRRRDRVWLWLNRCCGKSTIKVTPASERPPIVQKYFERAPIRYPAED